MQYFVYDVSGFIRKFALHEDRSRTTEALCRRRPTPLLLARNRVERDRGEAENDAGNLID